PCPALVGIKDTSGENQRSGGPNGPAGPARTAGGSIAARPAAEGIVRIAAPASVATTARRVPDEMAAHCGEAAVAADRAAIAAGAAGTTRVGLLIQTGGPARGARGTGGHTVVPEDAIRQAESAAAQDGPAVRRGFAALKCQPGEVQS